MRSPRLSVAIIAVTSALALVGGGCIGSSPTGQEIRGQGPRAKPNADTLGPTAHAVNAFAADFQRILSPDHQNVVFSPYGVAFTLGMVRAGAGGETRGQLDRLLHTELSPDLDEGLNSLEQELAARTGDKQGPRRKGRVEFTLASSLWGQRGTKYRDPYLDLLARYYDAAMRVVDFRSDPQQSRLAINSWVQGATNGNVDQILPRGSVSQYTRFLGTEATVLRAPWQLPFDPTRTRPATFHLVDGSTIETPSMQIAARGGLRWGTGAGWQAAEIPYLGDELGLVVVVPDAGTFDDYIRRLDGAVLDHTAASLDERPLDLRLPIFQFTTQMSLNDPLSAAGAPAMFSPRDAELPGITSDDALALSEFASEGFFGVNEDGTASPPGGASVTENGDPPAVSTKSLAVDGPFLFFVRDRQTGLILLLGQVTRPR